MGSDLHHRSARTFHFGDASRFAIRYRGSYHDPSSRFSYAWLHLVLGGQLIGDPFESCVLSTWLIQVGLLRAKVLRVSTHGMEPIFRGRTNDERFELIQRANGSRTPGYDHLPIPPAGIWNGHSISIDETTDAWSIGMIRTEDDLLFLWKGHRSPCPPALVDRLFTINVDLHEVVRAIDACLSQLRSESERIAHRNNEG